MKVAFLDTVHEILEKGLIDLGFTCDDLTMKSIQEIENSIGEYDGIVVRSRFKIDQNFLVKCTSLKFIARSGAGMENIDLDYCISKDIKLFNAPEGNRNAVAEHALGMILTLFNKLNTADLEVRSGKWNRERNRGVEMDGKVVGIIGFGNNGSAFAGKLSGFNVTVLAYDKYKTGFSKGNVIESTLEEIQAKSDIISFHIPQNAETIWMVDEAFINNCSKSFYLVNLSRGKIVVTKDLIDGLNTNKIKGACLDVLEFEKASFEDMFDSDVDPAFQKLIESSKVLLSPHVGGWTEESYVKLSKVLLEKISANFST